jgi:DNA-binding transcriptional LysR family regulator
MTPKQLRYFICTAEEGSFAAASRVLFIAQPSLSQQIANLEAELGVEVFLRQARGVLLTEAGEKLLEHAHAILRQIDAASADVSSTADNPQGTVKLGLTQSICNLLPLYLVEAAAKSYPGIEMDITAGLSSNLQQWLREGAIALNPLANFHCAGGANIAIFDSMTSRHSSSSYPVVAATCMALW